MFEKKKITSFDQNYCSEISIKNSEKYRELEDDHALVDNLITIGSGLSYTAAGFKKDSLSINIESFNRILFFDKKNKIITVEAGVKIFELLNFTTKYNLWIPQIPGHPFISIGGAVASNVHGKSCALHGTIRSSIINIKIFHKHHGWLNLSSGENKDIFELTIGGLGLTGTIVSVTFKLQELNNTNFVTSIKSVKSISETLNILELSNDENQIYSWNKIDSGLNLELFGSGIIFENKLNLKKEFNNNILEYPKKKIVIFPIKIWNNLTIKLFNYILLNYYTFIKNKSYEESLSNVIFPFFKRQIYFSLFGKKGFIESQILISKKKIHQFLDEFKKNVDLWRPSITIFSLKKMSGEQKYLRFEDNKVCVTFDLVKNKKNILFLQEIYKLYIKYNALPSIIKDSHLDIYTFNKCYPNADIFREDLKKFDPRRIYRSELSDKLSI